MEDDTTTNDDLTSVNAGQPTDLKNDMGMPTIKAPIQNKQGSLKPMDEETAEPEMSEEADTQSTNIDTNIEDKTTGEEIDTPKAL